MLVLRFMGVMLLLQDVCSGPSPTKITLSFDALGAVAEHRTNKPLIMSTIVRKSVVFYTYFDTVSSTSVMYSLIEAKVKRLPSFDWGCGFIDNYAVERNDTQKHIMVHVRRYNCNTIRPKLPEHAKATNEKHDEIELHLMPKENEMSKLLRFFVVPFLLTVVVVGYSLLRLLNNPQHAVSSPVLSTQSRGQEKNILKGKKKKQKLKQKKKLKRKEKKKLINDAIAKFPNQVSFLSTALSASDAKSMEHAVELLNEYLPELGKWKFHAKNKSNINLDGRSAGSIELNGNVLSEDASRKFAFLVKEIVEDEDE